jgi:hypothetical protein
LQRLHVRAASFAGQPTASSADRVQWRALVLAKDDKPSVADRLIAWVRSGRGVDQRWLARVVVS